VILNIKFCLRTLLFQVQTKPFILNKKNVHILKNSYSICVIAYKLMGKTQLCTTVTHQNNYSKICLFKNMFEK